MNIWNRKYHSRTLYTWQKRRFQQDKVTLFYSATMTCSPNPLFSPSPALLSSSIKTWKGPRKTVEKQMSQRHERRALSITNILVKITVHMLEFSPMGDQWAWGQIVTIWKALGGKYVYHLWQEVKNMFCCPLLLVIRDRIGKGWGDKNWRKRRYNSEAFLLEKVPNVLFQIP